MGENSSMSSLLLCLLVAILSALSISAAPFAELNPNSPLICPASDPLMNATHDKFLGQDVVWQIPPNPKAVLIIVHGMDISPMSYFDPGPRCYLCFGLPENRAAVLYALERGYAVIVPKCIDSTWALWPPEENQDLVIANSLMKKWTAEHSLESLPLVVWGYSSGGFFATMLTLALSVRLLVLSCCQGQQEVLDRANSVSFPPTFFAYMTVEPDAYIITSPNSGKPDEIANSRRVDGVSGITRASEVEKSIELLIRRGVSVTSKVILPRPIHPLHFSERICCVSDEMSQKIFAAYKASGWLDEDNYVTKNPRHHDWESILLDLHLLPFCKRTEDLCLATHIYQELTMAYAAHSMTIDPNENIFSWLDSRLLSLDQPVTTSASQRV